MYNVLRMEVTEINKIHVLCHHITPCIPLMQLNMLRHKLMQHFTRLVGNVKR